MKRRLALLFGMMISVSVARGEDVKINAVTAAGPKNKPTRVEFRVDAAEMGEKESKDPAEGDQYTFKVKNANVQRIIKLLTSEDGKKYLEFDIGKGIDVDEIVTLNWDKSTNKSGCEWYLKAVYADKSVGDAVRFNFCEENLIIEF